MGYINFRIGKIKDAATMGRARAHNQRIAFCENTDASRRFMNKQIMECAPDYEEFFQRRIQESKVYSSGERKLRSDAVRALDLEFRVSAEEMSENPYFDIDKFCDETRKWVCNTFGAENVVDLVLHMDEGYGMQATGMKCAPHIHAIVVPMTKDGRLSASEFIGSPQKLKAMQTSVANQYKSMRLKRGMEGSVAKHTEMKDYYGWVHAARVVNLPEPGEHEMAKQYAARIKPEIQKMQSQHLNETLKLQRAYDEAATRVKQLQVGHDTREDELEKAKRELAQREAEMREKNAKIAADYDALSQWKDVLRGLQDASMSEVDKNKFLDIANQALQIGRAQREAEEAAMRASDELLTPSGSKQK